MNASAIIAPIFAECLKSLWTLSYSQRFQDVFAVSIAFLLGQEGRQASYLEFGGMHPYNNSNSYLLEKLGWQGAVAEPNPAFTTSFEQFRNCQFIEAAISTQRGQSTLFIPSKRRARASLSCYADAQNEGRSISIELITLEDLIAKSLIDDSVTFLSADTEGGELETLLAYPSLPKRVRSICIEVGASRSLIYSALTNLGYCRVFDDVSGEDDWYIHLDVLKSPSMPLSGLSTRLQAMKNLLIANQMPSPGFIDARRSLQADRMITAIENRPRSGQT